MNEKDSVLFGFGVSSTLLRYHDTPLLVPFLSYELSIRALALMLLCLSVFDGSWMFATRVASHLVLLF